jgi:hypothetical protein
METFHPALSFGLFSSQALQSRVPSGNGVSSPSETMHREQERNQMKLFSWPLTPYQQLWRGRAVEARFWERSFVQCPVSFVLSIALSQI